VATLSWGDCEAKPVFAEWLTRRTEYQSDLAGSLRKHVSGRRNLMRLDIHHLFIEPRSSIAD